MSLNQMSIADHFFSTYRAYPVMYFTVLFGGGIIIGRLALASLSLVPILVLLALLMAAALTAHFFLPKYFHLIMAGALIILGMSRFYSAYALVPPDHIRNYQERRIISYKGWISEARYQQDGRHRYELQCESITIDSTEIPVTGAILLRQGSCPFRLQYGDGIFVDGAPQSPPLPENPGAFNYRHYLVLQNVYFQHDLDQSVRIVSEGKGNFFQRNLIVPLRQRIIAAIDREIPAPTNAVIKALLIGERQDVDREIANNFQKTGVIHVLAISGLHVAFILMMFMLLLSMLRMPYKWTILISQLFIFIYVAMVDFQAPVVRSAVMAALYYTSRLTERRSLSLNILAFAALLILTVDPGQLFQPGFQFSFAAVGGILYGYPKIRRMLPRLSGQNRALYFADKYIYQPLLVSAAAVLVTAPLTWMHYGVLQIGALLVNLFIIPMIGFFMALSFIYLLAAVPGFFALPGIGLLLHGYCLIMLEMIRIAAGLPFMQLEPGYPGIFAVTLSSALVLLLFNLKVRRIRWYALAAAAMLSLVSVTESQASARKMRVTFVSVGQGDAAILQFTDGKTMLVDAGEKNDEWDACERYLMPLLKYYHINHINYLVGSHAHSDHVGGFTTLLGQIKVDTLIWSAYPDRSKMTCEIMRQAKLNGVAVRSMQRGEQLALNPDCRVYILHPDPRHTVVCDTSGREVNNSSLVMRIAYGQTVFLLTGDLEADAENSLFAYDELLKADVLKVGHHGSKTSTSQEFLNLTRPRYGVISVGMHNRFFHPSRHTVERLRGAGAVPLRTDRLGALVFESDGHQVQIVDWRKKGLF
jgi:competence protein ComEC